MRERKETVTLLSAIERSPLGATPPTEKAEVSAAEEVPQKPGSSPSRRSLNLYALFPAASEHQRRKSSSISSTGAGANRTRTYPDEDRGEGAKKKGLSAADGVPDQPLQRQELSVTPPPKPPEAPLAVVILSHVWLKPKPKNAHPTECLQIVLTQVT